LAYDIVTDRIVAALESGTAPWRQPWPAALDGPRNIDGRPYRGVNVWLLLAVAQAEGYSSPYWLTFNQCQAKGGHVRKGARSTPVVFWKQLRVTETDDDGDRREKRIPLLRYFNVFNLEQCEGIPAPAVVQLPQHDPIAQAEAIVAGMPHQPGVRRQGDAAWYAPVLDLVQVPALNLFRRPDDFYSTLFHELGHATGHQSRLGRSGIMDRARFGSDEYGREELVAEMTAAFLCGETGILPATIENTTAYLANWITAIKEDRKAVVLAAGAAQKAADYILGQLDRQEPAHQLQEVAA
jgi:antirestriction protein ArdC